MIAGRVLNVGGGNKHIAIPEHFDGWDHQLLDIVPGPGVDIVCSALEMQDHLEECGYDAIYCSHNIEHYYRHDLPKVLSGFKYALARDGFVEIRVPNMQEVFRQMAAGKDIEDIAYISRAGPIRYSDMIYGMAQQIEASGNDFMSHKNGFTPKSMGEALHAANFSHVFVGANKTNIEVVAYAFKRKPSVQQMRTLKLKDAEPTNAAEPAIKPVLSTPGAIPDPVPAAPHTTKEGA